LEADLAEVIELDFLPLKPTPMQVLEDFIKSNSEITDLLIVAKDKDDDILMGCTSMDTLTAMYLTMAMNNYVMERHGQENEPEAQD